jgi:hypothetical protein
VVEGSLKLRWTRRRRRARPIELLEDATRAAASAAEIPLALIRRLEVVVIEPIAGRRRFARVKFRILYQLDQ